MVNNNGNTLLLHPKHIHNIFDNITKDHVLAPSEFF